MNHKRNKVGLILMILTVETIIESEDEDIKEIITHFEYFPPNSQPIDALIEEMKANYENLEIEELSNLLQRTKSALFRSKKIVN